MSLYLLSQVSRFEIMFPLPSISKYFSIPSEVCVEKIWRKSYFKQAYCYNLCYTNELD